MRTDQGDIEAEFVVNCAGMWARQLGDVAGVNIPLQAAEHYYLITEQIDGLSNTWPVIEDPANYGYYREEVGGLMIGLFESVCAPWNVGGIPDDFSFGVIQPDWDRMGPYVEAAMSRVPISMETGIRTFFCGPESFTPDLLPSGRRGARAEELLRRRRHELGRHPHRWWAWAGCWRTGSSAANPMSTSPASTSTVCIATSRTPSTAPPARSSRSGMVYQCHYPGKSMTTARDAKVSPIHQRLQLQRAVLQRCQRLGGRRLVRA